MKIFRFSVKTLMLGAAMFAFTSCADKLTELNQNPNGIDPSSANPNQLLPTVMTAAAGDYLRLGYGDIGGTVQHTQKDGWYDGHNHYEWSPRDWSNWYNMLRNNEFLRKRSTELGYKFHEGVSYAMRGFIFGTITDLWGDAPYSEALQGNISNEFLKAKFDTQEEIYDGIIADLKKASELFATKDVTGVAAAYDVYYGGNPERWQKFVNTLLLRYYMRISSKKEAVAKAGIEAIYSSGIYIKTAAEDATMAFVGSASGNSWPETTQFDLAESNWRRIKAGKTLVDQLNQTSDPRLPVWFSPVHVRWVVDRTIDTPTGADPFIRKDGVIQNNVPYLTEMELRSEIAKGHVFTRHFNPDKIASTLTIDTAKYVGVVIGIDEPSVYNYNPNPGQQVENQHVSQLAPAYRNASGGHLRARLASAAETSFILAEAALKGWAVGSAAGHYEAGIKNSLDTWGVGNSYAAFIEKPGVKFDNTLEQIMTQKWIASWTAATEAWFDYRRTGLPNFSAGPVAAQPVLPLRFIYGDNELNYNAENFDAAVKRLEDNQYTVTRGKNSQWSKTWLVQGTGKPW
jgi:hypothetical protein